ncbi:MAG: hypothetical protein OXF73_03395 [Gammaproteobacteria bacterium]|nr:hypothetical protein [Gammaproteobacteria bacterium]MCY4228237.1 hypothetical protein [Gammaproteobacteria bacterium]
MKQSNHILALVRWKLATVNGARGTAPVSELFSSQEASLKWPVHSLDMPVD